ncbi:MAG: hypothetical protein ACJ72D_22940 [Marmoricola sp.]
MTRSPYTPGVGGYVVGIFGMLATHFLCRNQRQQIGLTDPAPVTRSRRAPGGDRSLALAGLVIGSGVLGVLGVLVGLAIGLAVYPPTVWAAMVEVGLPAAVLGALVGVVVGAVWGLLRRTGPKSPRSS